MMKLFVNMTYLTQQKIYSFLISVYFCKFSTFQYVYGIENHLKFIK
ncbi:hypothetical protein pb186bvf_015301 [Paramecium bursaria]